VDAVATQKKFGLRKKLFAQVGAKRSFYPGARFQPFESKFHRDSDFETPVAIFVLHTL